VQAGLRLPLPRSQIGGHERVGLSWSVAMRRSSGGCMTTCNSIYQTVQF
jgi:hypothetical protein